MKTATDVALGRYRLVEKLAEGRLGEVFLAEDSEHTGEPPPRVTVERIRAAFTSDPAFVRSFLDEASTAAQLSHPNLVRVVDFGKAEDNYFVAMEHVAGHSARAILERANECGVAIPARIAAWIAARVCAALEHVHEKRRQWPVIPIPWHLTLPNILISDGGEVKLIAFGIHGMAIDDGAAAGGEEPGELPDLSPEEVRSTPGDERSDVFWVARALFELITGSRWARSANVVASSHQWEIDRALAEGRSARALSARSIHEWQIDRALKGVPDLPAALRSVLRRGLQSDPQKRFSSAEEMRSELQSFLAGLPEPVGEADVASFVRSLFEDAPAAAGGRRREGAPGASKVSTWRANGFTRTSLAVIGAAVVAIELFVVVAPRIRAARVARAEAQRAVEDLANDLPSAAISRFERAFAEAPSWVASSLRSRHGAAYVEALERDGARHLEAGDLAAARMRFEAAAEFDPKRLGPRLSLGQILARAADNRSAERELLAALAIDPASAAAREALGSIYFDQGRYAEALEQYKRLLKLRSGNLDEVWLRIAACDRHLARAANADAEAALQQGLAAYRRREQDLAATLALFDATPSPAETRPAPATPAAPVAAVATPAPAPTVAPVPIRPPAAAAAPVATPAPPAPVATSAPAAPVAAVAKPASATQDVVHLVECPGECLRDIAAWHTGSGENWQKLVSPVNRGVNSECVVLKLGREVRIPAALVTRAEKMPCSAVTAPTVVPR